MKKFKNLPTTSSDLVLWEGDPVPCIKLCKGDTVSDITYKLGMEICALKKAYDLTNLDLKCIIEACEACPDPVKSVFNVFQLIINKVCDIDTIIKGLSGISGTTDEKIITVAGCFLPMTDTQGDPITKLPHSDYTRLLSSKLCDTIFNINGLSGSISTLDTEIADLQRQISALSGIPKVSPKCVAPTNAPIDIVTAWTFLEAQFCNLATTIGSPDNLTTAIGKQPSDLSTFDKLSGNGSMSTITGWKPIVSNLGDSFNNLWLTVADIRGAVKYMTENCCKVDCNSIIVDFDIKLDDTRTITTLFFAAKTKLPVGFTDCNSLGNKLTITDSDGAIFETYIKISQEAINLDGAIIDISGSALNSKLDYTYSMDACMTDGSLTCQKCLNKSATYKDTCAYCEISVTAGSTGPAGGELVIIYEN